MATFEERYQAWKQKQNRNARSTGDTKSFQDRYTEWKVKNRGLDLNDVGQQVTDRVKTWLDNHNNYIQNYNNRFKTRAGDYTDSYVSDSRDWLDTVSQQARNFDIESNAIRGILDQYGSYFNPEWTASITKALDEGRSQQAQIRKAAAQDVSYWSQFKDEDAYKAAQTYDEQSKADLDQLSVELEDLKKQLEPARQIQAQIGAFNPYAYVDASSAVEAEKELKDQLAEATAPWGGMAGMEAAYSEKQQYYNTAKRIQDGMKLADAVNNADFKAMSGYQSTEAEDWYGKLLSQYGMGYEDVTYEYINGDEEKRSQLLQRYGRFAGEQADFDQYMVYDNMKDTEISIYNYYYNKEGKEKAQEYLDSIAESLNYRSAEQTFKQMKGNTLAEVFFGIESGVDQFQAGMKGLWNSITGKDDYIPNSSTQILGGMVREDLEDDGWKLPEWAGGSSLGQMAYDFLSTTTNMVPSLAVGGAVGLINPVAGQMVGAGLLGASAAGNAYKDMINQGYSKEQAGTYSALVGASEAGLSYLLGGIGQLGGKISGNVIGKIVDKIDNVFGRVAVKLGGTMLSEGFEEGLQEILTPWFQEIATNIEQDVNWEEAAYSSLLGALTGLFMEGPGVVANTYSTAQTGKALQTAGVTTQELTAIGTKLDPESVAYQLSERVNAREAKGKKTNAYTMGRMWNEIGQGMTEQNTTELAQALQDKGYSAQESKTIAKTFSAVTAGEAVTQKQINMLTRDSKVAEVIKNEILGKDSGISQRRAAYQQVADKLEGKTKAQPQSEATPAKEPTVSTDGKTYLVDTGEAVESLQIESVGNGNITYKVGDRTVDMDGVEYATQQEAVLHDAMSKTKTLNVRAANFMAQNIDPDNPGYAREAIDSYQSGWYGYSESKLDSFTMPKSQSFELYAYGKKAREEYDAKQKQAQSEASAAAEAGKKAKGTQGVYFTDMKGKTVAFDDANQRLSKAQKAGVDTAKFLNKLGLGGEIVFFRSQKVNGKWVYEDSDGKYHAAQNGMYTGKDGRIYIDLNTFAGSRGATLYTLSHELTHFIENNSPEQYKILADFLINEYDKTGKSMDERVKAKQAELEFLMDGDVSYDEAFRETVADAMQKLFNDGNLQNELVKLKQSNPEGAKIVQAIKDFLDKLLKRIRDIYSKLDTGSEDAETVAQMGESLAKLQKIFAAALVEASDNYTTYGAVVMDTAAESQYSTKNDGKFMDKAIEQNAKAGHVAESVMRKAQSLRSKIADRLNAIREAGKIAIPEDIEGNTFFGNSSYDGSEENTTICPRSLAAEAFVDAVSELMGRPLTVEEQIYISQDLQKPGRSLTPECTYCYVATDRKAYRAFLGEYVKQRDSVIEAYKNGNTDTARSGNLYQEFLNGRKDTDNMWKRFSMWINTYKNGTPMVEASHLASMEKLMGDIQSEFGKELKAQIKDAMAYAQSASWAKKRVGYVAYNGHILKWKQDRINKLNSHYGLRMYSFSDFSPAFILENMQMITDAAVRGLKMLGYTKELDFVKIFAPSGMNINISTFGFERAGNVYENNIIGANWEEAKALREKHPNVGITFVATNDTLVEWALEQDWVDVVIPYHLVRTGKELARKLGFTDYTGESADVKTKDWKPGDQKSIAPTEHNNDKATYLEALQKNHLRPRFERYIDNPNYMKLVNECRQSASESKPVQPIFNETAANESLAKLEANGYYQPIGGTVDRMYEIASDIADDIANGRVQFQAREETNTDEYQIANREQSKKIDILDERNLNRYVGEIYSAINRQMPSGKMILIGKTPKILVRFGAIDGPLYMAQNVARKASLPKATEGGKHSLGEAVVYMIPEQIADPLAITGQTTEHISKNDNGIVVWTNWKTETGDSVIVPIRIDLKVSGAERYNLATTIFDVNNDDYQKDLLRDGNIKYTKNNESIDQLLSQRRQLPKAMADNALNERINHYIEKVKSLSPEEAAQFQARPSEETSNRYLLANALESAAQTDTERQKLKEYRERLSVLEKAQDRLDTLNNSLLKYSTAKTKNYEKIAEFRKLAEGQAETVERIENRLAKMEQSKPLASFVQRQRADVQMRIATEMSQRQTAKEQAIISRFSETKAAGTAKRGENLPMYSVGAAKEGFDPITDLQFKYGNLPEGENPVRPDDLPKSTDGDNRVSLTARTAKGAAVTPDAFSDLIDKEVVNGKLTYLPIKNDETTQKAVDYITLNGWEAAKGAWSARVRKGEASAEMSAIGALLLNHAAQAGDEATWLEVLGDYTLMGTRAGQAVQAMRILKKLTPADNLYMIEKSVEKMASDLDIDVEIDPNLKQAYRFAKTGEERDAILGRIQKEVAQQLPTSMMEMWTALRYTNMLGNFKTQIRNVFGNTAMAATNAIKNTVAASLELLANKVTGGEFSRTKSITVSRELMKACIKDFAEVEALALDGGKYADAATSRFAKGIQENRTIFKAPESVKNEKTRRAINLALKPIEAYRRATSTAMEKGDLLFSKNAYARALAGYLKARGVRSADLSTVDAALMDEARAYAIKEAQEVTFRDHNALTELLSQRIPGKTKVSKLARAAAQGIMPFRQTPANVLLRAEEYSPLGTFNSIALAVQYARKKGITGPQLINSFAKTFTGWGLFALGMILSNLGMAVGGLDDDEGKEAFDKLNGAQSYALKFGDTTWTFDWLSPVSIPLFMGVNMWEAIQENGLSLDTVYGSLSSITEPMLQMSMLSGLSDTLEDVRYSKNGLVDIALGALVNYATQVMTNSLLAQLERSWEDIRYTTYTDKGKELPTKWQYEIGQASAKIPGVDYSQVPYINAWGEEEESLPFPSRLVYNLLSPAYHSSEKTDAVSRELYRLDEAQDENVFPSTPPKTYKEPKEDDDAPENPERYLSAEEYVALAKVQGTTQRDIVSDLVVSIRYSGLNDEDKARAIRFAYKYAKEYAQIKVLGRKEFSAKWLNAISGNVSEAILDHVESSN